MEKNVVLFIVDPQIDFCSPNGALYVKGAEKDMDRLAKMIKRLKEKLSDIFVSLDSHHPVHISHPIFWVDENGKHPDPFTLIKKDDVVGKNPKWRAYNPGYQKLCENYVTKLEANGRYVLCLWVPHCLIGGQNHAVQPVLFDALCEWEAQFATVNYVTKGSNITTEHYSIIQADVIDDSDPSTMINMRLIEELQKADILAIAGEASSHCVCNTVTDIANNFGDDNIKKIVYLKDACSPVQGFEDNETKFLKDMTARGMKISTTEEFLK